MFFTISFVFLLVSYASIFLLSCYCLCLHKCGVFAFFAPRVSLQGRGKVCVHSTLPNLTCETIRCMLLLVQVTHHFMNLPLRLDQPLFYEYLRSTSVADSDSITKHPSLCVRVGLEAHIFTLCLAISALLI